MSEEGKETVVSESTAVEGAEDAKEAKAESGPAKEAGKEKSTAEKLAGDDKTGESQEKPKDGEADKGEGNDTLDIEAFTLPEGMERDEELLGTFVDKAKELGLTQEQAQALVDIQAGAVQKQAQVIDDMMAGWQKETEADEELGGANMDENLSVARAGVEEVLNETEAAAFYEALQVSGLGSHPAIIRPLFRFGKMLSDDTVHRGRTMSGDKARTTAERMFGNPTGEESPG